MEVWALSGATVMLSVLGAALVCGLTFGKLQGKVEGVIYRLNRIESEHSQVMTGLADVRARVEEGNRTLNHIVERMDKLVERVQRDDD